VRANVLQTPARNQELTLPWAAADAGITESGFGAYSVAGKCVTAAQLPIRVNNGRRDLS